MAFTPITGTSNIDHLRQFINALSGATTGVGAGTPIAITAVNDSANYALSVRNLDATNSRAVLVKHSNNNPVLLVDEFGVQATADSGGNPADCTGKYIISSTTGTVWRNNMAAPVFYNFLDPSYGGVADYSTSTGTGTSNTTALNSLINTVSSAGGGTVYLPAGRYYFADVVAMKSNVTLCGDGPATVMHFADLKDSEYNASSVSDYCITVAGAWTAIASGDQIITALPAEGAKFVSLVSNTNLSKYSYGTLFRIATTSANSTTDNGSKTGRLITRSIGTSTGGGPTYNILMSHASPWDMPGTGYSNTTFYTTRRTSACDNVCIRDLTIDIGNSSSGAGAVNSGIEPAQDDATGATTYDVIGVSAKNKQVGIYATACDSLIISGVKIRRMWYKSIMVTDSIGTKITECTVERSFGVHKTLARAGDAPNPSATISIEYCQGVIVADNTLAQCSWGVNVSGSYDVRVDANSMSGRPVYFGSASEQNYRGRGIIIDKSSVKCTVSGNTLSDCMLTGITLVDARYCTVSGNTLIDIGQIDFGAGSPDSGYGAIMIEHYSNGYAKFNTVTGNTILRCTSWAIRVNATGSGTNGQSAWTSIIGNVIENSWGGILFAENHSTIVGNIYRNSDATFTGGAFIIGTGVLGGTNVVVGNVATCQAAGHSGMNTGNGAGFNIAGGNLTTTGTDSWLVSDSFTVPYVTGAMTAARNGAISTRTSPLLQWYAGGAVADVTGAETP